MDQTVLLALTALGGVIVGLIIGVLMGKRSSGGYQLSQQLENELETSKQELDSYKDNVQQHFSETAEAFKSLNESYGNLHSKLAAGAGLLCTDQNNTLMLDKPGSDNQGAEEPSVNSQQTELPLQPPRDYAPKKSPDEKGVLTEEFGLKKKDSANDDAA